MIFLIYDNVGILIAALKNPGIIDPFRIVVIIAIFVNIRMMGFRIERDLRARQRVPLSAFTVHVDVVSVRISRYFHVVCLFFPCDILIGDGKHGTAVILHPVVPPVIIFAVLVAMEVGNDRPFVGVNRFVFCELDLGDAVGKVFSVRMLRTDHPSVPGSVDRAVPTGQHDAVALEVILSPRPFDVEPRIGLTQRFILRMAGLIDTGQQADIAVRIHLCMERVQIVPGKRNGDPVPVFGQGVIVPFGQDAAVDPVFFVVIPAARAQHQLPVFLPVLFEVSRVQPRFRQLRLIGKDVCVMLLEPEVAFLVLFADKCRRFLLRKQLLFSFVRGRKLLFLPGELLFFLLALFYRSRILRLVKGGFLFAACVLRRRLEVLCAVFCGVDDPLARIIGEVLRCARVFLIRRGFVLIDDHVIVFRHIRRKSGSHVRRNESACQ